MIKLTNEEKDMLEGRQGQLKQVAMENIVKYAEVLGAKELCKVTKATLFCGNHNYMSICDMPDFHDVFSRMNLARNERIEFNEISPDCYAQTCVAPCTMEGYEYFNQSKEFYDRNAYFLEEARKAGVTIAGSCSPYLMGWIPVRGEHFVTTESSMTMIGNSLWGACCNADGIEAAFWSAICGRTPAWGCHLPESRHGTHLIHVDVDLNTEREFELFGYALGQKLPPTGSIPVLIGNFHDMSFVKLKLMMVALSICGNCRMCHIVGVTPEAPTQEAAFQGHPIEGEITITREDLELSYDRICDPGSGSVELVSLGCPHYDIDQIRRAAFYLRGKKVKPGVKLMIWTVYPLKQMADVSGYTKIIEDAGGRIFTSTCPTTIGADFLDRYQGHVYDSMKQIGSVRSDITRPNRLYYGDMERCLDAAISGEWKEDYRWKK